MTFEIILILIVLLVALTLYAVLGGADFGAGIWEFNLGFRASARERKLLYEAIGPVWETNHVWLIFILVLLFGAFPPAFAQLNNALFVPLLIALVGIVCRGAAFAFRSQLKNNPVASRAWGVVFAFASVLAPLFLGAGIGAIASGQLEFNQDGEFSGDYLRSWINPLSVFVGFFTVGLCAYTSATYMMREAHMVGLDDLVAAWRRRSLVVGAVMGALAVLGLILVWFQYPTLWLALFHRGWPLVGLSIVSGVWSLWAIYHYRITIAVVGVTTTCASVVLSWGVAQYPMILPPYWTAINSASPQSVHRVMLIVIALGLVILIPALGLLIKIFKMEPISTDSNGATESNDPSKS